MILEVAPLQIIPGQAAAFDGGFQFFDAEFEPCGGVQSTFDEPGIQQVKCKNIIERAIEGRAFTAQSVSDVDAAVVQLAQIPGACCDGGCTH